MLYYAMHLTSLYLTIPYLTWCYCRWRRHRYKQCDFSIYIQIVSQYLSVANAVPRVAASNLAMCPHQTYVFYKCIKSFMLMKTTLYWKNTMWTCGDNATKHHFETLNSPKNPRSPFVLSRHQNAWILRRQNCLQIGSRGPVTLKLAPSGF